MSFFAKGDFKIDESWDKQKKPNSRSGSRDKNLLFMNLGKNIVEPSTDILDDSLSKKIVKDFQNQNPPPSTGKSQRKTESRNGSKNQKLPPKQRSSNAIHNQSDDLLTSMAARLKQVETTCNNQRLEIKQKSEQIQKLKTENAFLKGMKDDSGRAYKQMEDLKSCNEAMRKKVQEMETYLKQYGLKWVGYKVEGKLQHDKLKKDLSNKFKYQLPSQIDINTIRRRVQDLNASLHQEGQGTEIYIDKGIHKLRPAEPLIMGFYADGIAIKGYKFSPYTSKDSMRILSDLLDGYFPYVLKNKYPNGVFLKVLDFVEKKYDEPSEKQGMMTFEAAEEKQLKPPSKEQFLNKLPKQIIKNGKVINIRSEIEKKLNGQQQSESPRSQNDQVFKEIDGQLFFLTEEHQQLANNTLTENEVCYLKIRTDSSRICILELRKDKKIEDVYKWMDKMIKKSYKLMGNFPRRSYQRNQQEDLSTLGFCPNGILHVQMIA